MIVHFRSDGAKLTGTIDFPDQNASGLPLTDGQMQGDRVHLRLALNRRRTDDRLDAEDRTGDRTEVREALRQHASAEIRRRPAGLRNERRLQRAPRLP